MPWLRKKDHGGCPQCRGDICQPLPECPSLADEIGSFITKCCYCDWRGLARSFHDHVLLHCKGKPSRCLGHQPVICLDPPVFGSGYPLTKEIFEGNSCSFLCFPDRPVEDTNTHETPAALKVKICVGKYQFDGRVPEIVFKFLAPIPSEHTHFVKNTTTVKIVHGEKYQLEIGDQIAFTSLASSYFTVNVNIREVEVVALI